MDVLIVRPTAVYGRWDNFAPETSHMIPALIKKIAGKKSPVLVWGSGREKRDFIHATDLAKGCLLMMRKGKRSDPVNLGYGSPSSVREVVGIIAKKLNYSGKIVFDSSKPTTIPFRAVNISKARRILGFRPAVSLDSGLDRGAGNGN